MDVAVSTAAAPQVSLGTVRWIGFKTIVIREYGRIIRIWGQTIVPSAVTTTLYFVIFGSLIGRRVGAMGGYDYMQYIAPGLIMMQVITNSYGNVVSSFFGAKFGKHIEELLVSPLPNWLIVAGYSTGGLVRGGLVGGAVTRAMFNAGMMLASHESAGRSQSRVPEPRFIRNTAVANMTITATAIRPKAIPTLTSDVPRKPYRNALTMYRMGFAYDNFKAQGGRRLTE